MKRLSFLFLFALAVGPISKGATASSEINLIPKPGRQTVRDGRFELNAATRISPGRGAESEAITLATSLRLPTRFPLALASKARGTNEIVLALDSALSTQLGNEGYLLSITPAGVLIRAADPGGLFYGGMTLRQLLPARVFGTAPISEPALSARESGMDQSWAVPCLEIEDRPAFPWRGLLIDVGRHFMPLDFLKKTVDVLALQKLNVLQLHLTDDQGWRIEIKKFPRLTEIGSVRAESPRPRDASHGDGVPYGPFFYTQAQLRDLVAYAAARHVTILPEIEMPGHFTAALAAYPEFSCSGGPFQVRTQWGVAPDILCPGNDGAVRFAQEILQEVMEVFPSSFIHIGGDEAPRDRWKTCPKCQARMRAEGLTKEAQLQTWFNQQIERYLTEHGRRLIGWDEILEGGLTPEATVMSWRGTEGGIAAANAGHDVVMAPTSHCYFDYAQSQDPGEPESIGGDIPLPKVYTLEPVPPQISREQRRHILGAQGNVWTEFLRTPGDIEYFAYPRAVALAEVVWSAPAPRDFEDFVRRLRVHEQRLDALHVHYRHERPRSTPPSEAP